MAFLLSLYLLYLDQVFFNYEDFYTIDLGNFLTLIFSSDFFFVFKLSFSLNGISQQKLNSSQSFSKFEVFLSFGRTVYLCENSTRNIF